MKKILVSGGAGFIGSEFVRQGVSRGYSIIVLDKLTYAGDLRRLPKTGIKFYQEDITNKDAVLRVLKRENPAFIVNFAAETHVDRSIFDATPFIETNVKGTQVLLDAVRIHPVERFLHISTDEVYGEIKEGRFTEDSPLSPNSPYAVSKAASDMLVKAYHRTYNLPVLIARPCNTYGPYQYPEKLIPLTTLLASQNKPCPVYGEGKNVREWLYLSDCADGIWTILEKGRAGEIYNVGSGEERENIEVVRKILLLLQKPLDLIEFVRDRPGHDFRYALSCEKIEKELSWKAKTKFEEGLEKTIGWYLENIPWLAEKVNVAKEYFQQARKFYKARGDALNP